MRKYRNPIAQHFHASSNLINTPDYYISHSHRGSTRLPQEAESYSCPMPFSLRQTMSCARVNYRKVWINPNVAVPFREKSPKSAFRGRRTAHRLGQDDQCLHSDPSQIPPARQSIRKSSAIFTNWSRCDRANPARLISLVGYFITVHSYLRFVAKGVMGF